MRWSKSVFCLAFLWVLVAGLPGQAAEPQALNIGILPTFNASGESFAPVFSQHLALKLFQDLQGGGAHAVLLNPGGLYAPGDSDFLVDYGKRSGVEALLITTLLKAIIPEKGGVTIRVQTVLLDVNLGPRSGPWMSTAEVSKRDASLDYGALRMNWDGKFEWGPSRTFEKQPLGKAMTSVAEQVHSQLMQVMKAGSAMVAAK